ncbi:hypothetical protein GUITHDRAFT_149078 [Guillardia theta CCMP2712]|uniref:SET domain-containing protein n=1 Tax=Guillardia theta (strain CCMP2712) TaxID=905079 RepID=L1I6A7_GUITC|nr:hypothetical protein GUITHDRAFT_149078 [Guillardia theta CCMP2712]EKX31766.1 hypothetical protein GUITHDRAFT_149078 [Guillardia theta CCMP2712]|eukprot:XP_005818746.1 hypothetical protein GUITHDRAFT_149078 [Guillardia theta CCMP2712]
MTTNGGEERTPKKRCVRGFQSRSEAFDACVLWVRERGGEVGPIVLREGEGGDCGVFTSSAKINKGHELVKVPTCCLLLGRQEDIEGMKLKLNRGERDCERDVALALALLHHRNLKESSAFHAYISTLPPQDLFTSLPAWWSREEREELLGSSELADAATTMASNADQDYEELKAAGRMSSSKGEFLWALACVSSRSFDADELGEVMVPILDCFNHKRPRDTAYSYRREEAPARAGFVLTSLRDLGEEEEVYIAYGAKGSRELLLNYGFCVMDNVEPDGSMNDTVNAFVQYPPDEWAKIRSCVLADSKAKLKRWGDEQKRFAPLRCAPQASYTYQPFTRLLDACRVILSGDEPQGDELDVVEDGAGQDLGGQSDEASWEMEELGDEEPEGEEDEDQDQDQDQDQDEDQDEDTATGKAERKMGMYLQDMEALKMLKSALEEQAAGYKLSQDRCIDILRAHESSSSSSHDKTRGKLLRQVFAACASLSGACCFNVSSLILPVAIRTLAFYSHAASLLISYLQSDDKRLFFLRTTKSLEHTKARPASSDADDGRSGSLASMLRHTRHELAAGVAVAYMQVRYGHG